MLDPELGVACRLAMVDCHLVDLLSVVVDYRFLSGRPELPFGIDELSPLVMLPKWIVARKRGECAGTGGNMFLEEQRSRNR